MELVAPFGVGERRDGFALHERICFDRSGPDQVRRQGAPVELHDIESPERRPETGAGIDPATHFEPSVTPARETPGGEAGRRVFREFPVLLPLRASRHEVRIFPPFAAAFDDRQSVFVPGVFGLVPL